MRLGRRERGRLRGHLRRVGVVGLRPPRVLRAGLMGLGEISESCRLWLLRFWAVLPLSSFNLYNLQSFLFLSCPLTARFCKLLLSVDWPLGYGDNPFCLISHISFFYPTLKHFFIARFIR